MNKKTITISIIILVIAIIMGGFWYTKNQKNIIKPVDIVKDVQSNVEQKENEIVSKNIIHNNKTTQELKLNANGKDMSNWETYQNEEYKFEIKYPKDWRADEIHGDSKKGEKNMVKGVVFSAPGDFPGGGTWGVNIFKGRDLNMILTNKIENINIKCGDVEKDIVWTKFKKNTDMIHVKVLEDYCNKQDWGISSIFIKNNNNLFIINNANEDDVNFKFTN